MPAQNVFLPLYREFYHITTFAVLARNGAALVNSRELFFTTLNVTIIKFTTFAYIFTTPQPHSIVFTEW